jgi:hypothetical protein
MLKVAITITPKPVEFRDEVKKEISFLFKFLFQLRLCELWQNNNNKDPSLAVPEIVVL